MWLYLFSVWLVLSSPGGTWCNPGKGARLQDCSSPAPNASSQVQPGTKVINKYFDCGSTTQKAHFISLWHLVSLDLGLCTGPKAPSNCVLCSGGKRRRCPLLDRGHGKTDGGKQVFSFPAGPCGRQVFSRQNTLHLLEWWEGT